MAFYGSAEILTGNNRFSGSDGVKLTLSVTKDFLDSVVVEHRQKWTTFWQH